MSGIPFPSSATATLPRRSRLAVMVAALSGVSYAGNYFSIPLFPGFDYLLGTIFVLIAISILGTGAGMVVAAAGSLAAVLLWGHPYPPIWYILEAFFVGWLLRSGRTRSLILGELLYWPLIGGPLIWFVFTRVMHVDELATLVVIEKSWVNGMGNALLASVILTFLPLGRWFHQNQNNERIPLQQILFSIIASLGIIPCVIVMAYNNRVDRAGIDDLIVRHLKASAADVSLRVGHLVDKYEAMVVTLAGSGIYGNGMASREAEPFVRSLAGTLPGFKGVVAADATGTIHTVYPRGKQPLPAGLFPALGGAESQTITLNRRDGAWLVLVRPSLRDPIRTGSVAGIFNLDQLSTILATYRLDQRHDLTLVDREGTIIGTTRKDLQGNQHHRFPGPGDTRPLKGGVSVWTPVPAKATVNLEVWRRSRYLFKQAIGAGTGWSLIVEAPVAAEQPAIYRHYLKSLLIMFSLILAVLPLSYLLSRLLARPILNLADVTAGLPERLLDGGQFAIPGSQVREFDMLISNFKEMARSLTGKFREISELNRSLEQRVEERTRELHDGKVLLQLVMDTLPVGVWVADAGGRPTMVNPAGIAIWEGTSSPDRGDFAVPDGPVAPPQAHAWGLASVVVTGEAMLNEEVEIMAKDGSPRTLLCSMLPLRGGDGGIIGAIAINEDITARKQAQLALTRSLNFHLELLDGFPFIVWRTDVEMQCNYLNRAWLEFSGATLSESLGHGWLDFIHPEDRDRYLDVSAAAFSRRLSSEIECRLRCHDGSYRWVLSRGIPYHNLDGDFAGYLGCCIDINDLRMLEEQLRQAQKMESIGTLAGGVAHDFNNILTVIMGCSSLLRLKLARHPEHLPLIDQVLESSEKAATLTRSLLAFSRKQVITPRQEDLARIVADMENFLRRVIGEDIELKFSFSGKELPVSVDRGQIEQVIVNLTANARDAMPDGGILAIDAKTVSLQGMAASLHGCQPGDYALLTMTDTGTGMEETTKQQIFDPFFTTKPLGKGTGLGLAMVYGIIKQHEGVVTVYSEPGKGTTFRVYLPLIAGASAADEAAPPLLPGGNETLLLVEDDEAVRATTADILATFGYRVLAAADGMEALERYRESGAEIALVILDVIMPRMNGRQVHDELLRINPGVKVIFTSGYTADLIENKGVLDEGTTFVPKPLLPHDILTAIRRVLDLH